MTTQHQRDLYRSRLEAYGVPETLAYMASLNLTTSKDLDDDQLISGAFIWLHTPQGRSFWQGVNEEFRLINYFQPSWEPA